MKVVVADPPWKFGDKLPGKSRGAEKNYACLSPTGILAVMHKHCIEKDCVLFLWRVSAMPQEPLDIIKCLGFTVKSEMVWRKLASTGKPAFGMGRYVRAAHETCLIATKGRAFPEARNVRSVFDAPRGRHSEKPDEFYRLVETMYPNAPRVELFARKRREGWEQYGDQLEPLPSTTVMP